MIMGKISRKQLVVPLEVKLRIVVMRIGRKASFSFSQF